MATRNVVDMNFRTPLSGNLAFTETTLLRTDINVAPFGDEGSKRPKRTATDSLTPPHTSHGCIEVIVSTFKRTGFIKESCTVNGLGVRSTFHFGRSRLLSDIVGKHCSTYPTCQRCCSTFKKLPFSMIGALLSEVLNISRNFIRKHCSYDKRQSDNHPNNEEMTRWDSELLLSQWCLGVQSNVTTLNVLCASCSWFLAAPVLVLSFSLPPRRGARSSEIA
jgi:hypothetical protein